MCGKGQESVAHVLAGCSAFAQTKYLERHNGVVRILFFEILTKYKLLPREEYAWYKRISPKPVYEKEELKVRLQVRANRIDAQVIDKVKKEVILIEGGGKSTDEDGGENAKVWSTQMGTQTAISRI